MWNDCCGSEKTDSCPTLDQDSESLEMGAQRFSTSTSGTRVCRAWQVVFPECTSSTFIPPQVLLACKILPRRPSLLCETRLVNLERPMRLQRINYFFHSFYTVSFHIHMCVYTCMYRHEHTGAHILAVDCRCLQWQHLGSLSLSFKMPPD